MFSVSYYKGATSKNHYDGRFTGGRFMNLKSDRRPEDEDGLVGAQEVSHY